MFLEVMSMDQRVRLDIENPFVFRRVLAYLSVRVCQLVREFKGRLCDSLRILSILVRLVSQGDASIGHFSALQNWHLAECTSAKTRISNSEKPLQISLSPV